MVRPLHFRSSCTLADPLVSVAGLCALGAAFCWFLYPETAGLSLEETREVFSESFGIKKANRLRKDKKLALRQFRGTA